MRALCVHSPLHSLSGQTRKLLNTYPTAMSPQVLIVKTLSRRDFDTPYEGHHPTSISRSVNIIIEVVQPFLGSPYSEVIQYHMHRWVI
jgi:hypothetical protein